MSDPRRDPDDIDSDDCTTDVGLELPRPPSLRLGSSKPVQDGSSEMEDCTEVKPHPARIGLSTAALPKHVRAFLEVRTGPGLAQGPFAITMVRTAIGRGRQADLRIPDARLSRLHAVIFYTGREFRLRDEESSNGTLLNGSHVIEYRVGDGDEIVVGNTTLVFRAPPPGRNE
jgi:FHA domain